MMTPQEVANCTFAKAVMGGYNMAAVDDFLDQLTEDYTSLHKENAALKAKIKVLVDKLEEYREMEDTMRATLLTAQKMANSLVSEAEAKRDALIADSAGAAKARLAEIREEVAREEDRLAQVRRDVDRQIQAEQDRLAVAQEELRSFIQSVQNVCQGQLQLLERLPELPAVPEPPVQAEAPAAEEEAGQAPGAAEEPEVPDQPEKLDDELEQDLADVFAALGKGGQPQQEEGVPSEDPFDSGDEEDGDPDATRVLNLDDLQFGRNYTRE